MTSSIDDSPFIAVPLKTTFEVDVTKALRKSLDINYSGLSKLVVNQTINNIAEFNKLRSRACCSSTLQQRDQPTMELVMKYYDQLTVVAEKLPLPAQGPAVAFKWNDAFDKGNRFRFPASLTATDLSFEQAAVLFNCGALMTTVAVRLASTVPGDDEALKQAAKLFQQAAGVFAQLNETVAKSMAGGKQAPTTDLLDESLGMLSTHMLAQAQEAIYVKARKDGLKSATLVKIAQQLADFYQQTLALMGREPAAQICSKAWTKAVEGKAHYYAGMSQLHHVEGLEASEIGEHVTRLNEAKRLLTKAKGALPPTVNNALFPSGDDPLADKVTKALEKAEKENQFIYHAKVPDFASLPELPKALLVKPAKVEFPLSFGFIDIFESLVQPAGQPKRGLLEKVWSFLTES